MLAEPVNSDVQQLNFQLNEANKRLSKARGLLLAGYIDADDYCTIKSDSKKEINRLEVLFDALGISKTNSALFKKGY